MFHDGDLLISFGSVHEP